MRELHCNLQILSEYEVNVKLKATLFCLLTETEIEHHPCAGESEGEGEPDTCQAPVEDETEEVARGEGDDEVGNEGDVHHRLYIGNATEGVGVGALQAVAELIDDERNDEASHHKGHFGIVGKPTAYLVTEQEQRNGYHDSHEQNQMKTGTGRMAYAFGVMLSVEIAHTHGHGCCHTIIHHVAQLSDSHHHLVSCQGHGSQPTYHNGGEAERGGFHTHL